jgi:hypothetical protein
MLCHCDVDCAGADPKIDRYFAVSQSPLLGCPGVGDFLKSSGFRFRCLFEFKRIGVGGCVKLNIFVSNDYDRCVGWFRKGVCSVSGGFSDSTGRVSSSFVDQ